MTLLASYNQWMNRRLYDAAATLPDEALAEDRGAFFGSVIGTLNHLVVADTIWLKRFASAADASSVLAALDDTPMPTALDAVPYPALPALRARREWLDALILRWVDTLTPALAGAVARHDAAIQALALSQQLMHGPDDAVALASRLALMQRVARENDPQAVVDPLPLDDDFAGFTRSHATRDERRRLGTLVHDSREAFLQSRNWDFGLVVLCHGIELRKRGSTDLIDLVDGWKSMDNSSQLAIAPARAATADPTAAWTSGHCLSRAWPRCRAATPQARRRSGGGEPDGRY